MQKTLRFMLILVVISLVSGCLFSGSKKPEDPIEDPVQNGVLAPNFLDNPMLLNWTRSTSNVEWDVIRDEQNPDYGALKAWLSAGTMTAIVYDDYSAPSEFKISVKLKTEISKAWQGVVIGFNDVNDYFFVRM
jgi:hypothetical protein